jgi:hypothetical protein
MALVLRAVERKGVLQRFDVVRADNGHVEDLVAGLETGSYKVLSDANRVVDVSTSYRTVQDITYDGETTTREDS